PSALCINVRRDAILRRFIPTSSLDCSMSTSHSWCFSRIGGFDQALLTSADDLLHLDELDPNLWAALACPTTGLHFDNKTLQLIDTDNDGRVRLPEVLEAVRWCNRVLRDPALLLDPVDSLPLDQLNVDTPEEIGRAHV